MQGADLRGLPHLPALPGASAAVKSPQVEVAFPTNVARIIPLQAPVPLRLRQRKPCPIGEVSSVLSGAQAPAAPSPSETPHVASHCDHHHLREEGDPRRCSFSLRHCCSVAQPCPALWDPMDGSTPGFPGHLPEFAQTHVRSIGDAIQPSHPLPLFSPFALNLSQHQGLFQ